MFTTSKLKTDTFIASAPRGAGLIAAVIWTEHDAHVWGWYCGVKGGELHAGYFMLQDFFTTRATRFYATEGEDVYGGWKYEYSLGSPVVLDPPAQFDDDAAHALSHMQEVFSREWLFFEGDPDNGTEVAAYGRLGLPVMPANVRSSSIEKLDHSDAVWRHYSAGANGEVLNYLCEHWPLDYNG